MSLPLSGNHNPRMDSDLPTLYEYYTEGGITAGLETLPDTFLLNKKNITIFSGSIHYFRVHPDYWRDRLRKLRAAGFNTVDTYIPWNLHEPERDVYDFGSGNSDMSLFLDVVKYIKTAQEEDLFVLVRPSPYICAEWDFGGMPSWLLQYSGLIVRSSEPQFVDRVKRYNSRLLPLLENLQFTKGGPIIAFQLENEYGALTEDGSKEDLDYLLFLKEDYEKRGIVELLYTSDNPSIHAEKGSLPGGWTLKGGRVSHSKIWHLCTRSHGIISSDCGVCIHCHDACGSHKSDIVGFGFPMNNVGLPR